MTILSPAIKCMHHQIETKTNCCSESKSSLKGKKVHFMHFIMNRKWKNLLHLLPLVFDFFISLLLCFEISPCNASLTSKRSHWKK